MSFGRRRGGTSSACDRGGHSLATERLTLRPATADDLDALLATIDPEVIRRQGYPSGAGQLRKFFHSWLRRGKRVHGYEHWVICDRSTGGVVGSRSLWSIVGEGRTCETGSWLRPEWRGRGFGVEELTAVLQFVDAHLPYSTVLAGTEVTNRAALQQYVSCGFVVFDRPGRLEHCLPDGRLVPAVWLSWTGAGSGTCPKHR